MQHKIGFYPCCCRDIEEPLSLLAPFADEVIFCDIDYRLSPYWNKTLASLTDTPHTRFLIGDVREVIERIDKIDVLFYRRDSPGEGGSGVFVLGDSFLPILLNKFNPDGGLIITDGSNSRGNNFQKMVGRNGMSKHGWFFLKSINQPYVADYGLHIVEVKPNLSLIQRNEC